MAAILGHHIWLSECGPGTCVRHRTRQCGTWCPAQSKWLLFPSVLDKFLSYRRSWSLRLVHALSRDDIVFGTGCARQSLGGRKDRRKSAGANTPVWGQMLDGHGPSHAADDCRKLS